MQQLEDFVERPGRHGARLVLGRAVGTGEQRLRQLDIPVAIDVPDEAIGGAGGLVEAVGFDRLGDLGGAFAVSCAIQRLSVSFADFGSKPATRAAPLNSTKRAAFHSLVAKLRLLSTSCGPSLMSWPGATLRSKREAQRVGAVFVDDAERVDDVALRLRHLGAGRVAHQAVDVDVVERHFLHEVQAHHHHARDPEEDDVEAGDQRRGRIVALELFASRPASPASRTATAPRRTRCRARPRRAKCRIRCCLLVRRSLRSSWRTTSTAAVNTPSLLV